MAAAADAPRFTAVPDRIGAGAAGAVVAVVVVAGPASVDRHAAMKVAPYLAAAPAPMS